MDIEESEKVLRKALDLGCSVLNTAGNPLPVSQLLYCPELNLHM